jgi:hypothetical protein
MRMIRRPLWLWSFLAWQLVLLGWPLVLVGLLLIELLFALECLRIGNAEAVEIEHGRVGDVSPCCR